MIKLDQKFDVIKLPKNVVLVEADPDQNAIKKIKCNDGSVIDLYLKNIFTEMTEDFIPSDEHLVFDGIVRKIPEALNTKMVKLEIEPGDHIICHHFLCSPEHMVEIEGKRYFMFDYVFDYVAYQVSSVYAKVVDDNIQMIGGWNLITPMKDGNEDLRAKGIEIPFEKEFQTKGMLEWTNDELGIPAGTVVHFEKDSNYTLKFGGKIYYRVHNRQIVGYEEPK